MENIFRRRTSKKICKLKVYDLILNTHTDICKLLQTTGFSGLLFFLQCMFYVLLLQKKFLTRNNRQYAIRCGGSCTTYRKYRQFFHAYNNMFIAQKLYLVGNVHKHDKSYCTVSMFQNGTFIKGNA